MNASLKSKISALALIGLSCPVSLFAVDTWYTGPTAGDWGTSGNWNTGNTPTFNDSTFTALNTEVVISSGSHQADTLWIGNINGGGGAGSLRIDGGTLEVDGGTGVVVGQDGRNGTLVLNNSGQLLRNGGNTTDLTIGSNGNSGAGTVIMNDSSVITMRDLEMSLGTGTSNFTINSGSATMNGWVNIGLGTGGATLNMNGGTLTSARTRTGQANNSLATLHLAGGILSSTGETQINNGANANTVINFSSTGQMTSSAVTRVNDVGTGQSATFNFLGGSMQTTEFGSYHGSTVINLSAGSLTNNNWFDLSANTDGLSTVNVNGGTLNVGNSNTSIGLRGAATVNISNGGVVNMGDNRFTIGEGRDNTTAATGVVNVLAGGTLNSSANSNFRLNVGGDDDANDNGQGFLNVNGGNVNIFAGGMRIGKQGGNGTVTQSSGTVNGPAASIWMADNTGATGRYNLNGGLLNMGTVNIAHFGNATFTTTGGTLTTDNLNVGSGGGGTPTGIYTQSGGEARVGTVNFGTSGAVGTLTLEGGTFGFTTMNAIPADGSAFNWGNASLTVRNPNTGGSGATDYTDNVNGAFTGPEVYSGSTSTINANIATGYAGATSVLDLGGFYINSGVRFDQMNLGAGGGLDLSAANDVLAFDDTTVYLLRPFGFYTEDYGSLPLITSSGGILTGAFDNLYGPVDDGRGYTQLATVIGGTLIDPFTDLSENQGVFQIINNEVWFHYRLTGTVPEPGTFGFMVLGSVFLKMLRGRTQRND